MDVDGIDLEQPAHLRWMLLPENIQDNTLYGGTSRDFGSISSAVLFWAEHVPAHQKYTAWIDRDGGPSIDAETISFLLDVVRAKDLPAKP